MIEFIIKKLCSDVPFMAALALIGQSVKRLGVSARIDLQFPVGACGIVFSNAISPAQRHPEYGRTGVEHTSRRVCTGLRVQPEIC